MYVCACNELDFLLLQQNVVTVLGLPISTKAEIDYNINFSNYLILIQQKSHGIHLILVSKLKSSN
jgi:hypothetical protein